MATTNPNRCIPRPSQVGIRASPLRQHGKFVYYHFNKCTVHSDEFACRKVSRREPEQSPNGACVSIRIRIDTQGRKGPYLI